jgi:membrane protein DedA with SNARE-associated domain
MSGDSWWVAMSIIILVIVVAWVVYRWWRKTAKIEESKPKK